MHDFLSFLPFLIIGAGAILLMLLAAFEKIQVEIASFVSMGFFGAAFFATFRFAAFRFFGAAFFTALRFAGLRATFFLEAGLRFFAVGILAPPFLMKIYSFDMTMVHPKRYVYFTRQAWV